MVLSVSAIALFGAILVVFIRKDGLMIWHALVAVVAGFQLSGTAIAGETTAALAAADQFLSPIF